MPPFLVGVLAHTVEVRTLLSGRLVQTLAVQATLPLCWRARPSTATRFFLAHTAQGAPPASLLSNLGVTTDTRPALSHIYAVALLPIPSPGGATA
jgi:hypothetical protein